MFLYISVLRRQTGFIFLLLFNAVFILVSLPPVFVGMCVIVGHLPLPPCKHIEKTRRPMCNDSQPCLNRSLYFEKKGPPFWKRVLQGRQFQTMMQEVRTQKVTIMIIARGPSKKRKCCSTELLLALSTRTLE